MLEKTLRRTIWVAERATGGAFGLLTRWRLQAAHRMSNTVRRSLSGAYPTAYLVAPCGCSQGGASRLLTGRETFFGRSRGGAFGLLAQWRRLLALERLGLDSVSAAWTCAFAIYDR